MKPAGRRLRRRSGDFEAFEAFPDAIEAFREAIEVFPGAIEAFREAIEAFPGARMRVDVALDAGSHRPTGNWRPALRDLVWGAFLPMDFFGF